MLFYVFENGVYGLLMIKNAICNLGISVLHIALVVFFFIIIITILSLVFFGWFLSD